MNVRQAPLNSNKCKKRKKDRKEEKNNNESGEKVK